MQATVSIPPESQQQLTAALRRTLQHKGGDPLAVVNKAARYVASFTAAQGANAKIPIANRERIAALLKVQISNSSHLFRTTRKIGKNGKVRINRRRLKPSKISNEWRGTLAAAVVAGLNYRGSSRKLGKRYARMVQGMTGGADYKKAANAAAFYRVVAKFVRARQRSAGYLRSGILPALTTFRAARAATGIPSRGHPHPPGSALGASGTGEISASMEDHATGIDTIAPNAFRLAEREVAALFDKWILEDMEKAAKATGEFTVV